MTEATKPMSWPVLIGILVATGLGAGLVLGTFGEAMGLGGGARSTGVGVCIGLVAALLLARRSRALASRKT